MKIVVTALLGLSALAAATVSSPARAAPELVVNGNFDQTSIATATQIARPGIAGTTLAGWTNAGYNFLFTSGSADTTGSYSTEFNNVLKLWGPGTGSANGLTASSPQGGNFVGADGGFEVGALSQTINDLAIGQNYLLTFYWAASQQAGYNGATTESWGVTFGNQTKSTGTVSTPDHGFTPWKQEAFIFAATATSQVLSFLAAGSPAGVPPFSLLDGISLTAAPEPATWAIMMIGLTGAAILIRRRNRRPGPDAAAA